MGQTRTISIRSAEITDDWAVEHLFDALHSYNATLDPRFALAEGWRAVLVEHLVHTRAFGNGLTLLAWLGENPVGLLMMGVHLDSRLFRHRSWAELLALYIVPDLRGGALSERLLALGTAWARERGHERIQLYVTSSNERAKQFYARAGFQAAQEIWRLELGDVPTLQESDRADEMREPNPLSAHTHYVLLDQDEV